MSLICISRGSFLGAKKVAEVIAAKIGLKCVSRELTIEVARDLGISEELLNENETRPPWALTKFNGEVQTHMAAIRSALLQQAIEGGFVYHGNVGHLLIADVPNVLRVRIVAPTEMRIQSGMDILGCSRKEAEGYLQRADQGRREWARALYAVDWTDASLYDITINLEFIGIEEACDLVVQIANGEQYQRTAAVQQQIENLALASLVEATIGISLSNKLAITADKGTVSIHGTSIFGGRQREIEAIARGVEGVADVVCELSSAAERMGF